MTPQPLTLDGLSGSLAAIAYGDPANPPILALHGWLDNAASLEPLAELIKNRYVVSLDFPGHGYSAHRPKGSGYHFADYVLDVAYAIDELGWKSCDLLGHSLGAGVSVFFAAANPEKVNQLILIDGIGPASAEPDKAPKQLNKFLAANLKASNNESTTPRSPKVWKNWQQLTDARATASPISKASAERLVRRGASESNHQIIVSSDYRAKLPSPFYLPEAMMVEYIKAIQSPVLLFLAKDSFIINRPETKDRIEAFKEITVKECDGQHHLHMDNPAPMAEAINTFLV